MSNLNSPQIVRGPLLASDLHRVTIIGRDSCTGDCETHAGCRCFIQAAEACTEIGADPDPYDGTAVIRGLMSAIGITALLACVVLALA